MEQKNKEYKVVELDRKDYLAASQLLASAFFDYPFMTYLQPNPEKRGRNLDWYMGFCIRLGRKFGRMLVTPGLEGVAIWLRPETCWISKWELTKEGMLAIPFRLGLGFTRRVLPNDNLIEEVRHKLAPEKHWYLWALGVHPACQHQGIGAALIEPVLREADAAGQVCYLETHAERNLAWYGKAGFEVVFAGKIPGTEVPLWAMLRPPQTADSDMPVSAGLL